MGVKVISRNELKRRMLQCGGVSPDDAENAAVLELLERVEELEEQAVAHTRMLDKEREEHARNLLAMLKRMDQAND